MDSTNEGMGEDELQEIVKRREAAFAEVVGLCAGTRKWIMSIPVEETRDSDRVIGHALDDTLDVVAEVRRLNAELQEWRTRLSGIVRAGETGPLTVQREYRELHNLILKQQNDLGEAREQLAEARAAIAVRNECIEKWGGHMAWCNVFKYAHGVFAGGPCHCGWAEWEVRLAALEPQPQPRSVGVREEATDAQ